MRTRSLLVGLLLVTVALAGCADSDDGTGATTTTTTTPTQGTTTTTTTTTLPTPPVDTGGKGVAALITLLSPPARAPADGNALVCWNVTGTGNVAHVAVHWDDASHPGTSARFTDYDQGAVYPDNGTQAAASGYDLPGTFCGNVQMPANGSVYLRAHVIDATGAPGKVSDEARIRATGNATIRLLNAPATAAGGTDATVCWELTGTANVAHTAIHWDDESHPDSGTVFSAYDQGAVYPGNATAADPEGYDLPGTFCANVPVPATGSVYFRAHVIDAAGAPGKLTDEAVITAA